MMGMHKTVVLAGHCGPDSSYLKMTVKKAIGDVHIIGADDSQALSIALEKHQVDLILFNRELGYGFDPATGVEAVRLLHRTHPGLKTIVVTNYPDVQRDAEAAGALPGFGKNELGSHRVLQVFARGGWGDRGDGVGWACTSREAWAGRPHYLNAGLSLASIRSAGRLLCGIH